MPTRAIRLSLASFLAALVCSGCSSEVKTAVKDQLVDPESAIFSDIETKDGVTCGVVNSKNRFGGYVGQRAFIYKGGQVFFQDTEDFNNIGYEACSQRALSATIRATSEAISGER